MERNKQERAIIEDAINEWEQSAELTQEAAEKLRSTLVSNIDSRGQLAQYFFIIAVSSALLAFGALFIDEKILEKLRQTFLLSNYTIGIAAAIAAGVWFYLIRKRSKAYTPTAYEVHLIPGMLLAIVGLVYLCKEWGNGASYTFFLGLNTIMLFTLAIAFRSRAIWVVALLSGAGWAGAFTTAFSNDNLFLGMNYPVRFAVLGLLIILASIVIKRIERLQQFSKVSWHAGLLIFFTGMWGVSIFGNYSSFDAWKEVRQTHVIVYAILFGLCSAGGLYFGIKKDDEVLRDYSVLFLLLNLYTRYFEYFWGAMNKGLSFLVLALSFWAIGRWLTRKSRKNAKAAVLPPPNSNS